MKPSIAEARKVKAAEDTAALVVELKAQFDRLEAKVDALLEQKAAAKPKATAEK